MKIGVISDTHNYTANLRAALDRFTREGIETVIHCGDLTNPDQIEWLEGFQVIFTFGNGDYDPEGIKSRLIQANPTSSASYKFEGEFEGAFIGVTHGHMDNIFDEMVHTGKYDFVFHGHSHRRKDEIIGRTRAINPGALGGLFREERSYCILDLDTRQVDFIRID